MKVERAKTEGPDANRPEKNSKSAQFQNASNPLTAKTAETANQGAFSKVLDAARETSESKRPDKKTADTESDAAANDTSEAKKDAGVAKKSVDGDDQNGSSGEHDGGDSSGFVPASVLTGETSSDTHTAVPQARAILHIADLERIVSAVRSESFAGAKQVTIDLKNSVLDGLRIQITLTEQGNIKAEFIALNEQIKKQLDARKTELQSVLKDRSIKCSELTVSVLTPHTENIPTHQDTR